MKYLDSKVFKVDLYNTDKDGIDLVDVRTKLLTITIRREHVPAPIRRNRENTVDQTIITAYGLGGDKVLGQITLYDIDVKYENKNDPQHDGSETDEQWEESK